MIRKVIILGILFCGLVSISFGQFYYSGFSGAYSGARTNFVTDSAGNIRFQAHDIGFSMSAGAFAGSNFHGNNWFGTFLSPSLAYNVSPRFRVKAGVTVTQGFGGNPYSGYDGFYSPMNTNATTTSIFIQGDYILSNKLMVSGAVYKYFSPYSTTISDPRYKAPEGEGYLFNINYRPARNFEINASIEYGNGNNLYYNNPFHQPGIFAP